MWVLVASGVMALLASLAFAGWMLLGFVICASTGTSCGGDGLSWRLLAIVGGGVALCVALLAGARSVHRSETARVAERSSANARTPVTR